MNFRDDYSNFSFSQPCSSLCRAFAALPFMGATVMRMLLVLLCGLTVVHVQAASGPALSVSALRLQFDYANGVAPGAKTVSIVNNGSGNMPWTAAADQHWITVSPAVGTGSATLKVSVNPAGLASTSFTGHVNINAPGATGSPQSIYVTLSVPSPRLQLSTKEVAISVPSTGKGSAAINLSNTGGGQLNWTAASQNSWLQATPASGAAPGQIQLIANLTGYAAGTYGGNVTVRSPGAEGSPAVISVKATVGSGSGGTGTASLKVSSSGLSFPMTVGGPSPAAQSISIASSTATSASWSAQPSQPWILLSASSGTVPSQLLVSVNPSGMTAGTHSGNIQINAPSLSGSPVTIAVALTITAPGSGGGGGTPPPSGGGQSFYVSPTGSHSAAGSKTDPWDLTTALAHPASVKPGDTIWLRDGVYHGTFRSQLTGTPDKPIIVRQYPGERAVIDTGAIKSLAGIEVHGSDTWYWGFEIMSSNPERYVSQPGPWAVPDRVDGIDTLGPRLKFINLIIHDTAQGFGFWQEAVDSEIYGCLLYYNGWAAPDRGHGHGIYSQNKDGVKLIQDNIQFYGFGMGIRAYGSENAYAKNIHFLGNVSFNSGYLFGGPGNHWSNYLVTVGSGSEGIIFDDNHSYHTDDDGYVQLGWEFSGVEKDLLARNNYFIGGDSAVQIWNWNKLTFTGNTIYSKGQFMEIFAHTGTQSVANYNFDNNTYYGSGLMRYQGSNVQWGNWQKVTGVDANSHYTKGQPTGVWAFVRPNKYEAGRANIIIYNWDSHNYVPVDVSGVLKPGQQYEVRDVLNYLGTPVTSGTYNGGPIAIPMSGLPIAPPVGKVPYQPKHTGPEFDTFVLVGK